MPVDDSYRQQEEHQSIKEEEHYLLTPAYIPPEGPEYDLQRDHDCHEEENDLADGLNGYEHQIHHLLYFFLNHRKTPIKNTVPGAGPREQPSSDQGLTFREPR